MDKFLKECFLQKTNQFGALKLLHEKPKKLELGAELALDIDNTKQWVVAKCEVDTGEEAIIGVFSEEDSKDIKLYLEAGWKDLFLCRISKYNADADENKRFSVVIHIKKKGTGADVQERPAQEEQPQEET